MGSSGSRVGGAAGSDFNAMQEVKEGGRGVVGVGAKKSGEVEGRWWRRVAMVDFGPREDASKEHLSQRPAGRIIRERELGFVCVCECVFRRGRVEGLHQ